jgi:hypothetical protein
MRQLAWKSASTALLVGLIMAGCGTQARWVNCEGRLEPINRPAPKLAEGPVGEEPAQAERAAP